MKINFPLIHADRFANISKTNGTEGNRIMQTKQQLHEFVGKDLVQNENKIRPNYCEKFCTSYNLRNHIKQDFQSQIF